MQSAMWIKRLMTRRQADILKFIADYQSANNGASPSWREIRDMLGTTSLNTVYHTLARLEDMGLLKIAKGRKRAIEILRRPDLYTCPCCGRENRKLRAVA